MHADMRKRLLLTFTQLLEMCERGDERAVLPCVALRDAAALLLGRL